MLVRMVLSLYDKQIHDYRVECIQLCRDIQVYMLCIWHVVVRRFFAGVTFKVTKRCDIAFLLFAKVIRDTNR